MDLKANSSPVLTDPVSVNKSRLGLPSKKTPTCPSSSSYLTAPRRKPRPGQLDDVRHSGWLDAMKSSSPPRKKLNKDVSSSAEQDVAYRTWMLKYPSALTSLEQITTRAKGKKIVLFLDYDGTLSPIVDNPDHAYMTSAMRTAVKAVAKHFPTAIISGRCRDKVYQFIRLTELYYAGSHGMDIMGPVRESESIGDHPNCIRSTDKQGKEVNLFQPASEFLPLMDEVFCSLVESTKDIKGAKS